MNCEATKLYYESIQHRLTKALLREQRICSKYKYKCQMYETFLTKDQIKAVTLFVDETYKHAFGEDK